ncbi:hypothetical protein Tco_1429913, partial [Tanacetum coccineum]
MLVLLCVNLEVVKDWYRSWRSCWRPSSCASSSRMYIHWIYEMWSYVATLGLEVANGKPWTEVKQMMTDEFCPTEEVQRFNELALLCPDVVPNEKKKVELYNKGLPKIIKGETTSFKPATLNEAVRMAHTLMEQKVQDKAERIVESNKRKWESNNNNYHNNNQGLRPFQGVKASMAISFYGLGIMPLMENAKIRKWAFQARYVYIKNQKKTAKKGTRESEEYKRVIKSRKQSQKSQALMREEATRAGGLAGGPTAAPVAQECTFTGFMKCGPTQFHGTEGAVGLCRWFEKMESTFEISEYAKGRKVATFGREVANGRPWTEVKQMLIDKFCPIEEVQRFNELALLCPDDVPTEKKKDPQPLNEALRMAHALMEQKIQAKDERIAKGLKRKWESNNQGRSNYRNNNRGNYRENDRHNQYNDRIQGGARAMTTAQNDDADQGELAPNCNRCGLCHFGQCPLKCNRCGRRGHKANYYRKRIVATGADAQPISACYECEDKHHSRNQCPNLADQRGGNATDRAYVMREADKEGPNVVA